MDSLTVSELPVVDFCNANLKPGSSFWISECDKIKHALEEYGFFIALTDKISPELHNDIFKATDELFEVPNEVIVPCVYKKSLLGKGGKMPSAPLVQCLGIENSTTFEGVQSFAKLVWPLGNDPFCDTSLQFARKVAELYTIVAKMLFESYGVAKYSESHIDSLTHTLRYLKYRAPTEGESNLGFPAHTDKSFITILYQNEISGLQIEKRDGEWISVEFPPKSFVVMAGVACQAWSNDRVLAPNHRVIMDKDQKSTRSAIGLFTFLNKNIEVPEELVDMEHPLKFKPFFHYDLLNFFATDQGRKSQNILKDFCGI